MDFLATFMGSLARAKVLRLFLFNTGEWFTISEISKRAQVSKDSTRSEIRFLGRLDVLRKDKISIDGKQQIVYSLDGANQYVQLLQMFARDTSTMNDKEIVSRLRSAGRLKVVIAAGIFVDDLTGRVDLLIVGDSIDEKKLETALRGIEADLGREIRYTSFLTDEFNYRLTIYDKLIRDIMDYPHRVFLDKLGVAREPQ